MKHFLQAFRPIAVDFLSTIFFVGVYAVTHDIRWAIALGIALGVLQIAYALVRGRKPYPMQWASLVLVVVLGSASLLTNDPRFAMIKPSIGGFAIGCVMLRRNWMWRYMPDVVKRNLSPNALVGWGYAWSLSFFALAAANLYIAYTYPPNVWAWFTGTVPTAVHLGLFLIQYMAIRAQSIRAVRARKASEALNGAGA